MSIPVGISGSRSAAVLGLSPYKTPVSVWIDIMGPEFCFENKYEYVPFEGNASTRWGSAFENSIIELTEQITGKEITAREKYFERDYITCHIDGIIDEKLYEGKTASQFSFADEWGEPGSDRIPINYQLQIQHNLMLTGLSEAVLSVLVFPRRVEEWEEMGYYICDCKNGQWRINEPDGYNWIEPIEWALSLNQMGYFHQYNIPARPSLQSLMLEKYRTWWEQHVIGRTEPKPQSYDDIRVLLTEPVGTVVLDEEHERLMTEYKNIGDEVTTVQKRREQIKVEVLSWARAQRGVVDDDSASKIILRGQDGRKLGSYGKNKNGILFFR